jgi:hypothetical protein
VGAIMTEGAPRPLSVSCADSSALHGLRTSPRGEPSGVRIVKKLNEYAMKTVNIQYKNEYNPK